MKNKRRIEVFIMGIALAVLVASVSWAQPGGRGRGEGGRGERGRGGVSRPGGGTLGLMFRPVIREELGLNDTQIEQLRENAEEAFGGLRRRAGGREDIGSMSDEERREFFAKMRQEREKVEEGMREKIAAVLTPEQAQRFAEIEFQAMVQRGDLGGALKQAGVTLSDEERQSLRDKQRDVMKKVDEQIAQLRRDAYRDILDGVVTSEQLDRLMGEPFELALWGQGGGPPPGFGRRDAAGPRRDRRPDAATDRAPEEGGRRRRRD